MAEQFVVRNLHFKGLGFPCLVQFKVIRVDEREDV
jgi:hypothetical protein